MPADVKWVPSKDELSFEIIVLSWDTYSVDAGYAIEEALEEIGFEITINEMDDEVMYPLVYENGYYDVFNGTIVEEYRKYEIYEMSSGFTPAPTRLFYDFHTSYDYAWGQNHGWVHDDTLDGWLELAMNSSTTTEIKNALWETQDIIADNVYSIPLFLSDDSHLVHKDWNGFVKNPGGIFTVWNIWSILNMSAPADTTFNMAYPSDMSHISPFLAVDARSGWVHNLIWDPMVKYDDAGEPVGWLATEWVNSADGTVTNFTIREGVKWHDGADLTPDDVKFSLDLYSSAQAAATYGYIDDIASVTVDGQIVSVTRTEPKAWTYHEVGTANILPEHIWTGANVSSPDWDDVTDLSIFGVGCGPFEYVSGAEGGPYTFDAFADYWYNGNASMPNLQANPLPEGTYPKTDQIVITAVSGEANRLAAMQAGTQDSERYECSNSAIESLPDNPNVKLVNTPGSRWDYYITINTAVEPLNDVNVRRAIAYALDKEAVAYAARGNYATVSTSALAEAFFPFWHNPNVEQYDYNIATAKSLLDAGGYIDIDGDGIREVTGKPLTTTTTTTTTTTMTTTEETTEPTSSEGGDGPGFELYVVFVGMFVAIIWTRKRK